MSNVIVLHGPPGTGKTSSLIAMFESAVRHYGPQQVAAVTYTRAAAREFQVRAAKVLGLSATLPRDLQRELPYVGTIHCSPPEEPILTVNRGYVPIAELQATDRLVSYRAEQNRIVRGFEGREGYPFERAVRSYQGPLITLSTATSTTRVTPNHQVRARFSENVLNKYAVYLMRRGDWWRIGMTHFSRNGPGVVGGVRARMNSEKGAASWILGYFDSKEDAAFEEARLCMYYGIPGGTFEITGAGRTLTSEHLHRIHEEIAPLLQERVERLLLDRGLLLEHPLYKPRATRGQPSGASLTRHGYWFDAVVANLSPDVMLLPTLGDSHAPEWSTFSMEKAEYEGPVYSLEVTPLHYYVSGGAIVHNSLAFRMIGNPSMVDRKNISEFFLDRAKRYFTTVPLLDSDAMPEFPENRSEQFLSAMAYARHKRLDPETYLEAVPALEYDTSARFHDYREPYRLYQAWKQDRTLLDFEDLLDQSPHTLPHVRVLFVDEAQDCSPLMFYLLLHWARSMELTVYAGDPFQALYTWAGADPELLIKLGRTVSGGPRTLNVSHRLPPGAEVYANRILSSAGWDEPDWMGTWTASADPKPLDGSEFYLARTRSLLNIVRGDLYKQGTPFRELRGRGPLETYAADAYRILTEIQKGELVPRGALPQMAKAIPTRSLYRGVKAELERQTGEDLVGRTGVEQLTREPIERTLERVPHSDYYRLLVATHGHQALYHTPSLAISTVHGAKGMEADRVRLLAGWGTLPYNATGTTLGAKHEACVAYVGATHHRESFKLVHVPAPGGNYPWP